jgi:protein-L-isoaspartate(D-aspartate) O-methyltransferase
VARPESAKGVAVAIALLYIAWLAQSLTPSIAAAQSRRFFDEARERMVKEDLVRNGIGNERVLEVMRTVPRHEFVPLNLRSRAYLDMALAIGQSQTISSPFVVAFMTEQLDPQPKDKVLEIGTGSGYQAAVLSGLVKEVYTIEIIDTLAVKAEKTLARLGYKNVKVRAGDGFAGWRQHAPFDKIIVTCSPESVPQPLVDQLREGGRMVIPVGQRYQQMMYLYTKKNGKLVSEALHPTFFVPMTGQAESQRKVKPDPLQPTIANGDFEIVAKDNGLPTAWYYLQQMTVVRDEKAPSGRHYAVFENEIAGRPAHALQGFPVDGRKVRHIELSYLVKADNVRPGETVDQLPVLAIAFFDERRSPVGEVTTRNWFGTFDWRKDATRLTVPGKAREASLRIGLLGATGKLSLDAIKIEAK